MQEEENVCEALVINGNLVQEFTLNQVEVGLLCSELRAHMALGAVAEWTSCNLLCAIVTRSFIVLFWMETAILFECDWLFP